MVVKKRKKVNRYRGHTTHGGGHRKKRRGAGSRGGRGNAGSGKRAGHMKQGIVLGGHGFTSKSRSIVKAVNLTYFTPARLEQLVAEGKAHKEKGYYSVDLAELGYTKLLGTGAPSMKLKLTVQSCSAGAAEKVKAAGGEVIITKAAGAKPGSNASAKEKEE